MITARMADETLARFGRAFKVVPVVRRWHSRRYLRPLQEQYHEGQALLRKAIEYGDAEAEAFMSEKLAVLETIIERIAADAVR